MVDQYALLPRHGYYMKTRYGYYKKTQYMMFLLWTKNPWQNYCSQSQHSFDTYKICLHKDTSYILTGFNRIFRFKIDQFVSVCIYFMTPASVATSLVFRFLPLFDCGFLKYFGYFCSIDISKIRNQKGTKRETIQKPLRS